jgi:hypothetical protein
LLADLDVERLDMSCVETVLDSAPFLRPEGSQP